MDLKTLLKDKKYGEKLELVKRYVQKAGAVGVNEKGEVKVLRVSRWIGAMLLFSSSADCSSMTVELEYGESCRSRWMSSKRKS